MREPVPIARLTVAKRRLMPQSRPIADPGPPLFGLYPNGLYHNGLSLNGLQGQLDYPQLDYL